MVRAVGGAVRDTLAGLPVSDVDLATRWLPEQVVERLQSAGIKAVPTGIAHGTITAVADGKVYEVTTLRRDVSTDGRHATVAFTDDWAEDAARRDFTINALYANPLTGELFDPTGGLDDLVAHRVRFIGDAGQRIDEDHLRILRWFRFLARFGEGAPDAETLALVAGRARQLRSLSRERIADELMRMLALPDPAATFRLMADAGIIAEIAPEVPVDAPDALARMVAREAVHGCVADPALRLIALLPADAALADTVASRLKLSNRLRKRIAVAQGGCVEEPVRVLAYRIGVEGARDRWLLADATDQELTSAIAALTDWTPPKLPISGGDIVKLGVKAGPEVARTLRAVEEQWLAEGFPGKERVQAIALVLAAEIGE
jgi:poly(A) polymerase